MHGGRWEADGQEDCIQTSDVGGEMGCGRGVLHCLRERE